MNTSTPALILGAHTHGSLGIIRSLGRLGVTVYGTHAAEPGAASFSRYCRRSFAWDLLSLSADVATRRLLQIGEQIGCAAVLIPTWDETAIFVAEHYRSLSRRFIYPAQAPELASALCSKKEMFFLAKKFGVPTAETVFPTSIDQVMVFAETAKFPVMLKGIDGNRLKRRTGRKMVIAQTAADLLRLYREMEDPLSPNLMLQEYIPGDDDSVWMFNGYFNEASECLVGFTGQKIRQTPVYTGMTSLGVCCSNRNVEQTTIAWMKELGYRGILDIGYRYDCRDGHYKVLDVNPRIGATFRLFTATTGLDVARALYLDLTGQTVPRAQCREGRRWMLELDIKSCLDYHRDGKLTLLEWLTSLRGVEELGYFALDDLAPLGKLCALAFSRLVHNWRPRVEAARRGGVKPLSHPAAPDTPSA